MEHENLQVGVVEGIVGIEHWEVTVEGFANHAGTTPMNIREDALLAALGWLNSSNNGNLHYDNGSNPNGGSW